MPWIGRVLLALLAAALVAALTGFSRENTASAAEVRVLVVKMTWGAQPFTDADVDEAMQPVVGFYASASFGRVALSYTQTPWLTDLTAPPACETASDDASLVPRLIALAEGSGYAVAGFDRVVFLLPNAGCGFVGINEPDGIVLNGTLAPGLVAHELGHGFGMGHALAFDCRYLPRRYCMAVSYGDRWDVMGSGGDVIAAGVRLGDFGALQKVRAGWLTPTYISKPGVYRLAPLEQLSTLPQALVIRTGGFEFWVDHREPLGNDAYLATESTRYITTGFEVHRITGDPLSQPHTTLTPDYLMPTGKANLYYTAPGKTYIQPRFFTLTDLSRSNGVIAIRFRWLTTPK